MKPSTHSVHSKVLKRLPAVTYSNFLLFLYFLWSILSLPRCIPWSYSGVSICQKRPLSAFKSLSYGVSQQFLPEPSHTRHWLGCTACSTFCLNGLRYKHSPTVLWSLDICNLALLKYLLSTSPYALDFMGRTTGKHPPGVTFWRQVRQSLNHR